MKKNKFNGCIRISLNLYFENEKQNNYLIALYIGSLHVESHTQKMIKKRLINKKVMFN